MDMVRATASTRRHRRLVSRALRTDTLFIDGASSHGSAHRRKEVWLGATREMVIEALGEPAEASEKVFKTKVRRVLKYEPLGGGRFGLKIKLEDDEVVGWER